ncbi:MAG: MarR family winged helix-turn-helix transcriptional regulator [Pseudomonadota bacterium]
MNTHEKDMVDTAAMADHFGPLSLIMLNDTELRHAWRVNFLANFFTGPAYRQIDEQFALTRPEFVILYCLKNKPGLVARDVCLVTGLPKNSISRAVSELLGKGLIERTRGQKDKRAKPLSLSEKGLSVLTEILPIFETRQDSMRAVLTGKEQAEFDRLIQKIVYAMPDWVTPE